MFFYHLLPDWIIMLKVSSLSRKSEIFSELTQVWSIAWPLVLSNILNVTVGLIDFKMVGALGVVSIAAVGMAKQVNMLIMVIMIAVSGGASVLIAHAHGAADPLKVREISARSVTIMLITALLLVTPVGLLFSRKILFFLGAETSVIESGASYLMILFAGSIFTMFNFAVSGILLGVGRTKISLNLLIFINFLNIFFNWIFINGIGPIKPYGVAGAAIGTILARALGSVAGFRILSSHKYNIGIKLRDYFAWDTSLLLKIFQLGGPRSLQGVVRNFSNLILMKIISLLPMATVSISAYSVSTQVRMTSSFVGLAFMSAAMARVGYNMGRKNPRTAEMSGWLSAFTASAIMTLTAICFLIFPEQIMSFFTDDAEVIRMGRTFFMTVAIAEPVMAFAFALGGALRGGGEALHPFIYSSISDIVIVISAGYFFAIYLKLGFSGIAYAIALSAFTRAIPTAVDFALGKWKKKRLI
ncbi:MAG: MATE family efflux transporter [Candidatus Cloacimonetes bacterium]|nr:MATE family efflux transporter [Candidatus Cloacimonadota bacterium]